MATIHGNSYKSIQILGAQDTSGAALYVYWALCAHANERGRSYPKINTLVFETGRSRPTVTKAINLLIELGLIEKVPVELRVKTEAAIAYQRTVYQINAYFILDGKRYPMLYVPSMDNDNVDSFDEDIECNEVTVNEVTVNSVNHYKLDSNKELDSKKESPAKPSGSDFEQLEPQVKPTKTASQVDEAKPDHPKKKAQAQDKQKWDNLFYAIAEHLLCVGNKETFKQLPAKSKGINANLLDKHLIPIAYPLVESGAEDATLKDFISWYKMRKSYAALPSSAEKFNINFLAYIEDTKQRQLKIEQASTQEDDTDTTGSSDILDAFLKGE